ncbi:HNH endonuclease [Micromonospora zamorensis]|uniref:HNH endonuclease n=1 Tax=Micromonospora zamorensis TaxID=709883 RepID=UPI0037B90178
MSLAEVTHASVIAAVAEFERLGRGQFLKMSGFGPARAYFLDYEGKLYDSKAIIGHAHGLSTGTPLGAADFTGGDKSVAQRLEALRLTVAFLPNPDWTRDEIILACELVADNGWRQLDSNNPRVKSLSALLQTPLIHPGRRNPDFRNPAGVARKTYNLVFESSNGNRLDRQVFEDFKANPHQMRSMAAHIRTLILDGQAQSSAPDYDLDEVAAKEGGLALREHLRRERDPKLRRKKIQEFKRRGWAIACEVCSFNFGTFYGDRGTDYIECHHRVPLHVSGETNTKLGDLALICSNCHRMIHRTKPWLTVEELRGIAKEASGS